MAYDTSIFYLQMFGLYCLLALLTANEALHAEINQWFRQIKSMHGSTLVLKLQILRLGKLLAHNVALYAPTSRQMSAAQVLARRLGVPVWTAGAEGTRQGTKSISSIGKAKDS